MSILLEALKKSAEQRRLGDTPTISTPVESVEPDGDALQHWIPLAMMTLSVILMAWLGWQQYQAPAGDAILAPPAGEVVERSGGDRAPAGKQAAPPSANAGQAVESTAGERGRTPIESFTPPAEDAQYAEAKSPRDETAQLRDSVKNYQPDVPAPKSEPGESRSSEAAPDVGSRDGQPAGEAVAAQAPGPAPRSRVTPHESEPISYWELPQGVRDSLPEIRITVLVYAENSEDRFLLMGGERLAEKDEVEGGLVLQEIRREGAVFKYRKYRFLVKG